MPIVSKTKGNLVKLAQEGKYKAIVQGCNCFCTMGSGLAPQIAKVFPEAEEEDSKTKKGDKGKLGSYSSHTYSNFKGKGFDIEVINAYTQFGFGGRRRGLPDVDYNAVKKVFTSLNNNSKLSLDNKDKRPVGIPLIGAGLAGGNWDIIQTIINEVTPDMNIELVEYDNL